MLICYTSTQNTCTRLVQITSRTWRSQIRQSHLLSNNSALHGGTIDNSVITPTPVRPY